MSPQKFSFMTHISSAALSAIAAILALGLTEAQTAERNVSSGEPTTAAPAISGDGAIAAKRAGENGRKTVRAHDFVIMKEEPASSAVEPKIVAPADGIKAR
jgi:acyl CoA:acetate/3-ketoacid CoA transferase alpha subunit